jgi:hypothetical protein
MATLQTRGDVLVVFRKIEGNNRCLMAIEVFLRGGLGNQLFQYAAGLYLSKKQDEDLILRGDLLPLDADAVANVSRWPVQISDFASEGSIISKSHQPPGGTNNFSKAMQLRRIFGDKFELLMQSFGYLVDNNVSPTDFSKLNRIRVVDSYCASSQPANFLGDHLREQLVNLRNPSMKFLEVLAESHAEAPINVHLRLGDYRQLVELYGVADYDVLSKVIWEIRESSDAPVWLFTDSPEDLTQDTLRKLSVGRVIGPTDLASPIENMVALSSGSSIVCANSTFSWWSAFLKGLSGLVYYPRPTRSPLNIFSGEMAMAHWRPYGPGT